MSEHNNNNMTQEQVVKLLYERNEQMAQELQALRIEQQQTRVYLGNNHRNKGLKPPQPDVFRGSSVDTFLFSIEKAFEFYEIDESRKVATAVNYFRDAALRWFKFMEKQFQQSPPQWKEFKTYLIQHFKPSNTDIVVRNKLSNLRQIGSVVAYNDAFNRLIIELPDIDENTKIDMYCRGLKQQIQIQVRLRTPESLNIAQTVAMNVDNIISATSYSKGKSLAPLTKPTNGNGRFGTNSSFITTTPMELGNTEQVENDHNESEKEVAAIISRRYKGNNKLSDDEIQKLITERKCFKCKRTGHIARRCPGQSKY
jgi:hypothetical protein